MDAIATEQPGPAPEPALRTSENDSGRIQRLLSLKASALNVKGLLLSKLGQEAADQPGDAAIDKETVE
jgi:hypothetical protein